MAATREEISGWLDSLYDDRFAYTHMLVMCDTFDWEDYPVYVTEDEDVREVEAIRTGGMQTVMEVYSKALPKDAQLAQYRARNY